MPVNGQHSISFSTGRTVSKSATLMRVRGLVGSERKVREPKCWNGQTSIVRSYELWFRASCTRTTC